MEAAAVDRELRKVELTGVIRRTVERTFDRGDENVIVGSKRSRLPRAYVLSHVESSDETLVMMVMQYRSSRHPDRYGVVITAIRDGAIAAETELLVDLDLEDGFLEEIQYGDLCREQIEALDRGILLTRRSRPFTNREMDALMMPRVGDV